MSSVTIDIGYEDLKAKISRNQSIIGKRAKGNDGKALFSMVSVSTYEEPLFDDLLMFGAENIVSELSDVSSSFVIDNDSGVSFVITSSRWNDTLTEPDLKNALSGLISSYMYNFCVGRYLASTGVFDGFSKTYNEHCNLIIQNIKTLAFLKREAKASKKSYGDY